MSKSTWTVITAESNGTVTVELTTTNQVKSKLLSKRRKTCLHQTHSGHSRTDGAATTGPNHAKLQNANSGRCQSPDLTCVE